MSGRRTLTDSWSTAYLGDLFEILDSRRVPINSAERTGRQGSVPYYGATGQVGWIDDYLFDEELVLLGEDGAPFLEGDRSKAYVIRGKTWVNNHVHVLRPLGGTPSLFWKYQLDQTDYHPFVSGTTRLKLPQAPMRRIPLLVPPLAEQRRIVEAIESYFTRLDDTVATLERVGQSLKHYRASVLKAAVEGRLVPTEAELARVEGRHYEPASVLLERILADRRSRWEALGHKGKFFEPLTPRAGQMPALPEGWCWATVDMLARVGTGATPARGSSRYWVDGKIPWVSSGVIWQGLVTSPSAHVTAAALSETNLTLYPPGTLIVAMYGEGKTRGKCAELAFETTTNQALAALVMTGSMVLIRPWLRLFLDYNYDQLRMQSAGGVQPNLNLTLIRGVAVPLPPLAEQARITSIVEAKLSLSTQADEDTSTTVRRCARLRQAILKWAFEGRLADQIPEDEPASVLLARIKGEREAARGPMKKRAVRRNGPPSATT